MVVKLQRVKGVVTTLFNATRSNNMNSVIRKKVEGTRTSMVGRQHLVFYTFLGWKYIKSYAKNLEKKGENSDYFSLMEYRSDIIDIFQWYG